MRSDSANSGTVLCKGHRTGIKCEDRRNCHRCEGENNSKVGGNSKSEVSDEGENSATLGGNSESDDRPK
ncbi:hypothetical protein ACHAXS_006338 [Conticribra weissflogii]